MNDDDKVGFDLDGEFVPLAVDWNHGKDLMLIDRVTGMGLEEFIESLDSGRRGTVMLAMLATSLRAAHPEWSVERIYRMVTADLSGLEMIGGDAGDDGPPAEPASDPQPSGAPEASSSDGSSPSPTLTVPEPERLTSEPLYAAPA